MGRPDLPTAARWRRRAEVLGVSALGGLLYVLSTRDETAGFLLGLAYTILVLPAVVDRWRSPILGMAPGLIGGWFVLHSALKVFAWWVPVGISLVLVPQYLLAAVFAYALDRVTRWPLVIVLPLSFGAEEVIRPLIGTGNFNAYGSGTFLFHYTRLIQAADLIGAIGLTVVWAIPWAAVAEFVRWRIDGTGSVGARRVAWSAVAGVAVFGGLLAYGEYRLGTSRFLPGPRLAIVQANVDHEVNSTPNAVHVQQELTEQRVEPGSVDLIVWPENSIFLPYENHPEYQEIIAFLAVRKKAPMLIGTQGFGPDHKRPTGTAFLVDGTGKILGRYDKIVLFPFTERQIFGWLENVWPWLDRQVRNLIKSAWGSAPNGYAATEVMVLRFRDRAGEEWVFSTPLCYDSGHPSVGRDATAKGAQFLVNMTSEAWLGYHISNNQMGVNILRAVENRVGVVRVGNNGPSCFITPAGRITRSLLGQEYGRRRMDRGVAVGTVMVDPRSPTLYTRWGGAVDTFWPLAWVGCFGYGLLRRRRRAGAAPQHAAADRVESTIGAGGA